MTKEYPNFYENLQEAERRLKNCVVTYDGVPYYILCIADHKPDGIFRVYMDPIGSSMTINTIPGIPYESGATTRGPAMDQWMDANPTSKIVRKTINSPSFNRFRPFSLGMINQNSKVYYVSRHPARRSEQGLTTQMLDASYVTLAQISESGQNYRSNISVISEQMRDCITGSYPSIAETISKLTSPDVLNEGVAFHREFALLRGPMDTMFLAYKSDIIGLLPNGDLSKAKISKKFPHTKEVVINLGIFNDVSL